MAYASWSVVFGEQPSAAKWNILGTNDAHFYSFLGDNLSWQSWSITWTNLTEGNGTETASYIQIGKTVFARFLFTFGSTSAISGSVSLSLPVTSATYDALAPVGSSQFFDASGANNFGPVFLSDASTANIKVWNAAGTYLAQTNISSTVPFTWATSDKLIGQFVYEAA